MTPPWPGWVARAAAAIPASIIAVFIGLLGLAGLACGEKGRTYVLTFGVRVMSALTGHVHDPPQLPPGDRSRPGSDVQ